MEEACGPKTFCFLPVLPALTDSTFDVFEGMRFICFDWLGKNDLFTRKTWKGQEEREENKKITPHAAPDCPDLLVYCQQL